MSGHLGFVCGHCGYVGEEGELPVDPDKHPCGKDECPQCGVGGCITCCFTSADAAEERDESRMATSTTDIKVQS